MIVLNTNAELKQTFTRLIRLMKEPVEWNGQFVVIGDYLILHGRLRSLCFNFESRKVQANLIDIPVKEEEIIEIEDHAKVQNVLNLTLYAFGKWGMIHGIKVEQDYAQLNRLFDGVLREFSVEPGYSKENFRFYKDGVRLNYEDVVSLAAAEQKEESGVFAQKEEIEAGLWHKLVWKQKTAVFGKTKTTFDERQKNRLGQNFYMVGSQCPKCRRHLHMAVFPEGEEFRIETSEGGVFLARVYTCDVCHIFYTPRPEKLLSEGEVYTMDFLDDVHAYEDYKELLGEKADRVSNFKFNEFEEIRKRKAQLHIIENEEPLEEVCSHIGTLSDEQLDEVQERIEAGFYPILSVQRLEGTVQTEDKKRMIARSMDKADETARKTKESADSIRKARKTGIEAAAKKPAASPRQIAAEEKKASYAKPEISAPKKKKEEIPAPRREAARKRYAAKCDMLERLSLSQLLDLKNELLKDKSLYDEEKEPFLSAIKQQEDKQKRDRLQSLATGCKGKSYEKIRRSIDEIKKIDLPPEEKDAVLKPLYEEKESRAKAESAALLEKMPESLDLKQYRSYLERLKSYTEVDLSPYSDFLNERGRRAQKQEIANMIGRAKALDRPRITALMERLNHQGFERDILEPYLKELEEKLHEADENTIAEICGNPMQMTISETMEAYEKIEEGVFLPELKKNALEMLKKRLSKLKTDECELLVHKLKNDLEGRIKENSRHHFYPAKRVWAKEAEPEEYAVIDYALNTYGTARGLFEYPILVVDTSRDRSGKEGMILTPEHLFYRTMLNAFAVSVKDIKNICSQTGFFNTGLFLEMQDGSRIKIPYAVERKEIVAWGNCLEEFIFYLKEKPESRKVTYLAKEKHEMICCFRCGYAYKEGNVCPKCGYKMNR